MDKYVNKDIICAKMMYCNFRSPDMTVSDFINDELPAADVQPVKHGKWLTKFDGDIYEYHECSECGNTGSHETPYCAQCGARMESEKKCDIWELKK